ncbi:amidohydrolase [Ruminiclostridium papyrosolvens DSM 2782]|uniref:Amidohydrolase n=1 Tax=Ruminiclostridium papyrosolvens DSM 2782 TaxID=588581 RepID=F1TFQ3_9FIRM|nr:amidohydrolase [Ruminiclostridium papyrosolvens]EGD46785.1 amidohydrolase [Ruminiclostridium papyrosolvens DSM 2782]WES34875.1 amidohydrolase [Ruminiclostridium papyrosolvens DSM 2782]
MLLIYNGNIVTMSDTDYENGYVLIDNDKITAVGKDIAEVKEQLMADTKRIDANGGYVLPGFIDPHSHIGMWEDAVGFEGDDGNESTDPVTPQLRAIDAIYHADRSFAEAYESGVTTVVTGPGSANVIGGQFAAIKTFGRCVDEMVIKQPVAMKVAFGENPKTVYNEKHQAPMTRMATAAILRESLFKAKEYQELWEEYKKDPEEYDKPEFDFKMEALLLVLNRQIPLKAHAHRADDIITAIRIAKEFDVDITLDHCTEGYLIKDILAEAGLPVIIGPMLTDRSKIELRNQNLKTPGILSKAGLKVAIMTDHPCVPEHHLCLCAAIAAREGMDEKEALKAITINAAEITGISDRVGSIEKGKDADIVIFNGNPLELKTTVQKTIIDGVVIYERKQDE